MTDGEYYSRTQDEGEDDEDELGERSYKSQKDALLFAIEVSESMLQPPPQSDDKKADKDSPLHAALKCAYQLMQQRIISNPKDMMGIVLFGTQKFSDRDKYPHCYVLTEMGVPAAEDVKALRSLVEEGDDPDRILVPSNEKMDISQVFFLAKSIMQSSAPNFDSRKIFIITNNDDPHQGDKKVKVSACSHAKDLYDLGVLVELFSIIRGENEFDYSKFYDDILYRDRALEEITTGRGMTCRSGDGSTLLHSLISNISSKQTPKRAYFNLSFEIGPGFTISVKGYNLIQKQQPARSCYIWVDGEKLQIAHGETTRLADDSARTVENNEVKPGYKFGGEYVCFQEDEQKELKQFGEPCIRMIGFKDRSLLPFWASIKKSIFIFPSEEGYVGSTRVFTALWQKLLKSKKMGIAWHIPRKNGSPQLVAIVPSKATDDETSGTQYLPAGLWLYPIPYIDDVREGPEKPVHPIQSSNELTDKMRKIVQQMQLPAGAYNPSKYPNPALQWHYKILQALALEDEVPENPEDATVPKYRAIHKRCGGYIQDWSQAADEELGKIEEQRGIKRDLEEEGEDQPRPAKKSRNTTAKSKAGGGGDSGGGISNNELKKRFEAGTLSKFTVAELRAIMGERGLEAKGLKKDLCERLERWVEDNIEGYYHAAMMDTLGFDHSRSNTVCASVPELQGRLHQILTTNVTDTRAEHVSINFELRSQTIFHITEETEASDPAQQPPQPTTSRTVTASDTIQDQPSDDPSLQRAVAKHISTCIGEVDHSTWNVREVARGKQGWTLTYICKDSSQAWNRANAKGPQRPSIGAYSGSGGLDPLNLSRPAFDCRGILTIAFSRLSRAILVQYEHTPLHRTVAQLVEQLAPIPVPTRAPANGNTTGQRTPKAKRAPPAEGEEGSRKKKTPKAKRPTATDGDNGGGEDGTPNKKRTPKPKRPREGAPDSSRKRQKKAAATEADTSTVSNTQASDDQVQLQNVAEKITSTAFLNVPPAEAERRRQTAIDLLTEKGIDPATLSSEQFNIFANQAPNLQAASLDMLARYGAERLRIVHPDEKEQAGSTTATPTTTDVSPAPATALTTETPTKTPRRKKKKSDVATEVPIGNGAVVPVEQSGHLGTTESALKPKAVPRARKTRGACTPCKQRKVKCTKEHPSCSTCKNDGLDCAYPEPRVRKKSGKSAEVLDNDDSDGPDNVSYIPDGSECQPEPETEPQLETLHSTQQPTAASLHPLPQDLENEEFIPDPNILSGPNEHHGTASQSLNNNNAYYHNSVTSINFPSMANTQGVAGSNSMPAITYPVESHENNRKSSATVTHSSASVQTHQSPSLAQRRQSRKSLPTGQAKQTPVPPPTIPTHTSNWTPSPTVHNAVPQNQSPMTRSPYQSAAHPVPIQGRPSRPPPSAPSAHPQPAASSVSYNTSSTSGSVSNYDQYPRYGTDVNSHSTSRVGYESSSYHATTTTAPTSYSSSASYEYGRGSGGTNPLSQALNTATEYGGTTTSATSQWPTSQTRTQNPTYSQPQSQSYNSYSSQPQTQQQNQQNWYHGFTTANSGTQNNYSNTRQSGFGGHRSNVPAYSSQYNGADEQVIYDLLRNGGSNH
ncbi:hypothetical protein F5Y16DRAFT_409078 [Xylariaceae sp. FL0255]|nr:hypothetical protein F5Y16DRAFT_409078 [Xylariaceae sp. FL0255]